MNKITLAETKKTNTFKCHLCYNVSFTSWVDYHQHYGETHSDESKYSHNHAAQIRTRAMAEPKKLSTRTKAEIVKYGEEMMSGYLTIIKGYEGRGIYE